MKSHQVIFEVFNKFHHVHNGLCSWYSPIKGKLNKQTVKLRLVEDIHFPIKLNFE